MNVPKDLKYADSHEWMRAEEDGTVTIGITDHAQEALGDLVFIELPAIGRTLAAGEACAVVEAEISRECLQTLLFRSATDDHHMGGVQLGD